MTWTTPTEVRLLEVTTGYQGFFRIDLLTLQFRRFGGEWTVVGLLWFARNRDRLRQEWLAEKGG
jgi:hypothetical protein